MFMRYQDGFFEALSLAVARTYLGNAAVKIILDEPRRIGGRTEGWMRSIKIGDVEVPLDRAMTAAMEEFGAEAVVSPSLSRQPDAEAREGERSLDAEAASGALRPNERVTRRVGLCERDLPRRVARLRGVLPLRGRSDSGCARSWRSSPGARPSSARGTAASPTPSP